MTWTFLVIPNYKALNMFRTDCDSDFESHHNDRL